ncbi:MAG: rhomboid family intramembrane serine protease [Anaerolineae bacterium]
MIPLSDDVPGERLPLVTGALVLINTLIFLLESLLGPMTRSLIYTFGVIPLRLTQQWANPLSWLSLLTSMFLHGGWAHLIGNMLYLWIFGNNVEDRMGHGRFLGFYLLSGILASLAQVAAAPQAHIPSIGASGAIAGVLGAYLLLFPYAHVRTLVPMPFWITVISIPAPVVLIGWFIIQFFNGLASLGFSVQTGGVAWWAHIGGFVAGMVLMPIFRERYRRPSHDWFIEDDWWREV